MKVFWDSKNLQYSDAKKTRLREPGQVPTGGRFLREEDYFAAGFRFRAGALRFVVRFGVLT